MQARVSLITEHLPHAGKTIGRVALWLAVVVVLANGVAAIVTSVSTSPQPLTRAASGASTSTQEAEAFAVRFATDYLTFTPGDRSYSQRLGQYMASGVDDLVGWDGKGRQTVTQVLPVAASARAGSATVTVAARTGSSWVYLQVPLASRDGSFAVTSEPVLVPAPPRASISVQDPTQIPDTDSALSDQLRPTLTAFLKAFARGDQAQLDYFAAPGVTLHGLDGRFDYDGLEQADVTQGDGHRTAVVEVRWADPNSGATFTQPYQVSLTEGNGRWYVAGVGAVYSRG